MNRRDFLKTLTVVSAGAATTVIPLPKEEGVVKFEEARLKRFSDGKWFLDFSANELLTTKLGNDKELVAEIGDYTFVLKQPGQVEFSTEHFREGRIYHHWITGHGWEQRNI